MLLKHLLAAVEEIEKDLAYTQNLEAKWEKEAKRFPVICEYIKKQVEFFREEIEKLFSLNIDDSAISEFVKTRRHTSARISEPETAAMQAPEGAQKNLARRDSEEMTSSAPTQESQIESSTPASLYVAPSTAPPAEEKEKVSARKRSEKKSGDKRSTSGAKSRKHAGKEK
jgi:cobalamin biosynthesis Mg chelatase CobN